MDRFLRDLSLPSGRLAEYLDYLGLSYKDLEAHYGVGSTTWQVAATSGKKASSKIMDAFSKTPPPKGKQAPNISWLLSGERAGDMLSVARTIQLGGTGQEEAKPPQVTGALPDQMTQGMDYGREAARVVLKALASHGLEGKLDREIEDWLIDQYADGLASGRMPQLLEARLALSLQMVLRQVHGTKPE